MTINKRDRNSKYPILEEDGPELLLVEVALLIL